MHVKTGKIFAILLGAAFFLQGIGGGLYAQSIQASCSIDWTKSEFLTSLIIDTQKAGITMPSGRAAAQSLINSQLPLAIKDAFLSIAVNSSAKLGDLVVSETLPLERITSLIDEGPRSAAFYVSGSDNMQTAHTVSLTDLSASLVAHRTVNSPARPLDTTPTRPYTGIIIDARGKLPIQGEFISAQAEPCLFPQLWDENMNLLFERNMMDPQTVKAQGMVQYSYSSDRDAYSARVGKDPLHIRARRVYGINRSDLVISRTDALKILSIPENAELLAQGKVVILMDREMLVHQVAAPKKTPAYYVVFNKLVQHLFENKVPDIRIVDSYKGIIIMLNDIKFIADSEKILPEEKERVSRIMGAIRTAIENTSFSILVEGHTARIGRVEGELELSIARAKTIVDEMIQVGIPENMIEYRGYGGTIPVASNDDPAERPKNRRVEITIMPEFEYTVWY